VQKVILTPDENRLDGVADKTKSVANADTPMPELSEEFFSITPNLDEIQQTEITGLWSSKVSQTGATTSRRANSSVFGPSLSQIALLIKNILCRQSHSPSTKHLVFSAWRDALVIVKAALDQNAIAWVDLDDRKKNGDPVRAFTDDPSITVFLMHGERSASGLTLTAASVVHLLEPLINSSFEAQAIGRVDRCVNYILGGRTIVIWLTVVNDRIGQRQKTEVYW
jgi:SNF2 family DNA or RNA helicase